NVWGSDTVLWSTMNECYSWSVETVCRDSSVSAPTYFECSCSVIHGMMPKNNNQAESTGNNHSKTSCITASPNPAANYIDFSIHSKCRDANRFKSSMLRLY